jgi:phage protein D
MSASAAPTLNFINIKVNGSPIAVTIMNNLISAEVESSLHLPAMATLKFHDVTLSLTDGSTFALGTALIVEMGHSMSALAEVFNGEVVALEPVFDEGFSAILTVRAYDKLHRLNRATKTRALLNVSDSDVVSRICQEAGLTAQVQSTTPVHPVVWQDNQTDLAFLHVLARRNGFLVSCAGSAVSFKPPASLSSGVTAIWGENLRQFEPRLTPVQQVNSVTVKGWDIKQGQAIVGTASSATNDHQTGISNTGGAAAQQAFSGTAEHVEPFVGVGVQAYAQKIAQAMLNDINSQYVQAEGRMMGDGRLTAGKQFTVQKVGTRFSGTYRATVVIHTYRKGEFDTYFRVEGARPDGPSTAEGAGVPAPLSGQWQGVYPALVTNIADPDNLMRVKLKFPWLSDTLESDWAPVIMPVGIMSTPQVNSPVAVAFEQGNFNRPYVLGGMYNTSSVPLENNSSAVANGARIQQVIRSKNGHTFMMQDKSGEELIKIVSQDGAMKVLIDITNKKITIESGQDIDVTATGNIKLTATGNLEMSGAAVKVTSQGQMDLSATGVTNLKGSMVNIN